MPVEGAAAVGGTLYVVATPIGNLSDVTMRALEVLRAVPLIAAEDTRISRRLLARYEIETRTTSFHAQSGPYRLAELLVHLRGGADLALVTDAGTPAVSDPGSELVAAWAAEGGTVVPIPGASAVLAAVGASAIAGPRWGFEGFLPRSGRERRERLARLAADDRATVLFEAPPRLAATLRDLAAACGEDRPAEVCRELTKLHEQIARGTLAELATAVGAGSIPARGEVVVVVAGATGGQDTERASTSIEDARAQVAELVRIGTSRTDAARHVAATTGHSRRDLYRESDRA
ncbi:MAG: 16S rRNA (cytidine(1402)-2'-O)-methyltransferase [Chloroflexi bacterium]|nr:16S rRNA (cytidine(1402)-2'-O)-methyltransferase [Chloroflexota bacterium]